MALSHHSAQFDIPAVCFIAINGRMRQYDFGDKSSDLFARGESFLDDKQSTTMHDLYRVVLKSIK